MQGGTFLNDAILRSTERIMDKEIVRPDIAGIMGAYGAAIIAKEYDDGVRTRLIDMAEIENFTVDNSHALQRL